MKLKPDLHAWSILLILVFLNLTPANVFAVEGETKNMGESLFKLIRNMVVSWEITEVGAPTIDPEMPYGSTHLFEDVKRITGVKSSSKAKELHRKTEDALWQFLQKAELKSGEYLYPNLLKDKNDGITVNILEDIFPEEIDKDTISFYFKDEHLKLLRVASIRWTEWDEEEGDGFYPTAGIDPKRPYGDMTFYFIDMAEALNLKYQDPEELEGRRDLMRLHHEMQIALQVFLRNAHIDPQTLEDSE
jgi:hypothetical protein